MRLGNPSISTALALLLALIAGSPRRVAGAGMMQSSDGTIAPAVESFGPSLEGEIAARPSRVSRDSLPLVDLQSPSESELGVPLYEQDLPQGDFGFHLLPEGLIYRSYLGGPREPRMSTGVVSIPDDSTFWESTVGGRVGMFRIGSSDPIRPRGFQFDVEAAALLRLDIPENVDVRAADYRVGLPLTWGNEFAQWKFAYYHVSSHLGDEFLEDNPDFPMFRQARDALVLGHSVYLTDSLRIYGEVGWAFYCVSSEPWEFQFGLDYAPRGHRTARGSVLYPQRPPARGIGLWRRL